MKTSTPSAPSARTTPRPIASCCPWVSAETLSMFLNEVAQRHAEEFIVMVMDQAGWHIAGDLAVPQNMRVVLLSPYSPELNPAEQLCKALREDCFANRDNIETALPMAASPSKLIRPEPVV